MMMVTIWLMRVNKILVFMFFITFSAAMENLPFISGGIPIAGWFIEENPNLKWMLTGVPLILAGSNG